MRFPANALSSCTVSAPLHPAPPPSSTTSDIAPQPAFVTTHWSVVLSACGDDPARGRKALEKLCQTYWLPLYSYVRRRGYTQADAEDLTQGFFARLLRLDSLSQVHRAKGKFRSFMLSAMNHFLADEWDRAAAQKRGAQITLPLDVAEAETRYQSAQAASLAPDRLFERQWALALLDATLQRLRQEYDAAGRAELFQELRFAIAAEKGEVRYAEPAARLGMTEQALRVAAHRLRRRYREILRQEIANTLADPSETEAELKYLRRVLSS